MTNLSLPAQKVLDNRIRTDIGSKSIQYVVSSDINIMAELLDREIIKDIAKGGNVKYVGMIESRYHT